MIWKSKEFYGKDKWARYFAFFPRRIGGIWIWLEWYDLSGWYRIDIDIIRHIRYPSKLLN